MIAGGFGMSWRRILARMNHGSQTKSSWLMNFFVGTWKTSVMCVSMLFGLDFSDE
jgi:hypothetical protein